MKLVWGQRQSFAQGTLGFKQQKPTQAPFPQLSCDPDGTAPMPCSVAGSHSLVSRTQALTLARQLGLRDVSPKGHGWAGLPGGLLLLQPGSVPASGKPAQAPSLPGGTQRPEDRQITRVFVPLS